MSTIPFQHLLLLEPLGLLYGSSGRMLSPEALTGRASEHFPPDSPTLAGLIASQHERRPEQTKQDSPIWNLHTAGPFCFDTAADDLWLPAPFTLLQQEGEGGAPCLRRLQWRRGDHDEGAGGWSPTDAAPMPRQYRTGGWVALRHWDQIGAGGEPATSTDDPLRVEADPWQAVPHLHPRLDDTQRVSAIKDALFLEYGIALKPGIRLAYLSSHALADGRYRFGGEGHLVELRCREIPNRLLELLRQPLKGPFALVTPGVWGGPRLSRREPLDRDNPSLPPWHHQGDPPAILTERPRPWRHQLGSGQPSRAPRLSRGRWALPAGTCYRVAGDLDPWVAWPESWFPKEGFSFKQLGTALALPLHRTSS